MKGLVAKESLRRVETELEAWRSWQADHQWDNYICLQIHEHLQNLPMSVITSTIRKITAYNLAEPVTFSLSFGVSLMDLRVRGVFLDQELSDVDLQSVFYQSVFFVGVFL